MKICMVTSAPFPPEEGIGYYIYNLSKKLIEKGHKIIVITRSSQNKIQTDNIEGIEVIRAPFVPIYPFYLKYHGKFVNNILKLRESEIDIIHFHSPLPPTLKTIHPKVTSIHTPMLSDYRYVKIDSIHSLLSKISAKFVSFPNELKLIQASDIITTVSNTIAQELKELYNLNSDKIFIIENGVDEKFFFPKEHMARNVNKYILFAGRMDREKGLFDLLECCQYVCKKKSDISFILAGHGRDYNTLKRKIKKVGLQDKFILLGQVSKEKLVELYQNATLFVFPSYHEGLPTVLLEAMSCGLPIIATNVRGNRDLINHGENGILVPARDPKKMAEAISLLLDNEILRNMLGKNARKTIEERYSWEVITNKFLKCYESLFSN